MVECTYVLLYVKCLLEKSWRLTTVVTKCCGPSGTLMRSVAYPPRFLMRCVPATCVLAPKRRETQDARKETQYVGQLMFFMFPENVCQPSDLYPVCIGIGGTFLQCAHPPNANSRSDTNFEVAGSKSQNVRVFHVTLQIVCLGEDKFTFVRLFSSYMCVWRQFES